MSFTDHLRVAIKGHTHREVSKAAGVHVKTIGDYMRGDRDPSFWVAAGIAKCLGQSLDTMCDRTGPWEDISAGEDAPMGYKIRTARKAKGLSLEDLSDMLGQGPESIGLLERGRTRHPGLFTVLCIADALDVSLDWLAGLEAPDA